MTVREIIQGFVEAHTDAPSRNPYQEAAERVCDHVNFGPEEFQVSEVEKILRIYFPSTPHASWEELADRWEPRLRSALPAVSPLLGELAVLRGALEAIRAAHPGQWAADVAEEATAPGSDRLAGEVIRAAVEDAGTEGSSLRLISAVSALLDAHPEMGREVEGG